jgi:hypothetical protein
MCEVAVCSVSNERAARRWIHSEAERIFKSYLKLEQFVSSILICFCILEWLSLKLNMYDT